MVGENQETQKPVEPNDKLHNPASSKGTFAKLKNLISRKRSLQQTKNKPTNMIPEAQTEEGLTIRMDSNRPAESTVNLSANHRVYRGLEKLSMVAKDEELYENFLNYFTETAKEDVHSRLGKIEDMQSRLNEIKSRKKALLDECGIDDEIRIKIYERTGIKIEDIRESSFLRRLLVEQLARELPSVPKDYQRLFRGEGPVLLDDVASWTAGKWFHVMIDYASAFPGAWDSTTVNSVNSRYLYVDIPQSDLKKYHVMEMKDFHGASKAGEFLIPDEIKSQAKEFVRFITADTIGDPWASK